MRRCIARNGPKKRLPEGHRGCGGGFRIWDRASCWRCLSAKLLDGLAGGLDDRRHSQAGRSGRAGASGGAGRSISSGPLPAVEAANDEWSVDFKGWFRTGDGSGAIR